MKPVKIFGRFRGDALALHCRLRLDSCGSGETHNENNAWLVATFAATCAYAQTAAPNVQKAGVEPSVAATLSPSMPAHRAGSLQSDDSAISTRQLSVWANKWCVLGGERTIR